MELDMAIKLGYGNVLDIHHVDENATRATQWRVLNVLSMPTHIVLVLKGSLVKLLFVGLWGYGLFVWGFMCGRYTAWLKPTQVQWVHIDCISVQSAVLWGIHQVSPRRLRCQAQELGILFTYIVLAVPLFSPPYIYLSQKTDTCNIKYRSEKTSSYSVIMVTRAHCYWRLWVRV